MGPAHIHCAQSPTGVTKYWRIKVDRGHASKFSRPAVGRTAF